MGSIKPEFAKKNFCTRINTVFPSPHPCNLSRTPGCLLNIVNYHWGKSEMCTYNFFVNRFSVDLLCCFCRTLAVPADRRLYIFSSSCYNLVMKRIRAMVTNGGQCGLLQNFLKRKKIDFLKAKITV